MSANKYVCIIFLFFLIADVNGQQTLPDSITIIPGTEYKTGWLHRFIFGDHWRDLWTLPVKVPILNLDTFTGGLEPIEESGGTRTLFLSFKSNDGRLWKFRPVKKDTSRSLPDELRGTLVENVLQDKVSWANPFAPFIVSPLLKAVNIHQAEPQLVYLPDDEILGTYREKYANLLGIIEIHPDKSDAEYYDSEKVIDTNKLLERLEEKSNEKVNAPEFLKTRLMDVYLGDWGRHSEQWFKIDGEIQWLPIPRDRDQAFAKFDGLLVRVAEYIVPQFASFSENYPQIEDITWSGRFLDRKLLTEIDKHTWDSVAVYIQSRLTDDIIIESVKHLPEEHFKIAGEELIHNLKKRRDNFLNMAEDYYDRINKYGDVYCSEKNDFAEVIRVDNNNTEVNVYKKTSKGERGEKIFHKMFDNNLTREIRVYLNNGDDKSIISGTVDCGPNVRIIGGKGVDEIYDESVVNGYLFSFLPIQRQEKINYFYDSDAETKFSALKSTIINTDFYPESSTYEEKYEPRQKDRGHDWAIFPYANFNTDDGIVLGGGTALYSFNFRKLPYSNKINLFGAYATKSQSYNLEFDGILNSLFDNTILQLHISKSELKAGKYYGYGNETNYSSEFEDNDYYKLEQDIVKIFPSMLINLSGETKVELGIAYTYSFSSLRNRTLIKNFPLLDYGLGKMNYLELNASIEIDARDNKNLPMYGNYFKTSVAYFPGQLDVKTHYGKIGFDYKSYYSFNWLSEMTISVRSSGATVIGDFPYFNAVFLGGEDNLRGYNRDRFSGKSMLFGEAELRTFLTETAIILKGRLGMSLFSGLGRIFVKNDTSSKWHPSYGVGVWMSFINRGINISGTVAFSPETISLYASTSFAL